MNSESGQIHIPGSNESGAVLVLLVLLLVSLFSVIAFAIDITRMAEAREQGGASARLAGLAAVEGYFGDLDKTQAERTQLALDRANEVLSSTRIIGDHTTVADLVLDDGSGNQSGAVLTPGFWNFTATNTGPCAGQGANCFAPIPNPTEADAINAFQVSGPLFTGIKTLIAEVVLNQPNFQVPVHAIATSIPRHTCFAVDVSASVTRETHLSRSVADQAATPESGYGSEYAFYIGTDDGSPPADFSNYVAPWNLLNTTWNRAGAPANTQNSPICHFRDDYRYRRTLIDSDYKTGGTTRPQYLNRHPDPSLPENARFRVGQERFGYEVDAYRNGSYVGAEPLNSIMYGLNQAVDYFAKRRVSGDMACLILFDHNLAWYRTVIPTDDFNYLKSLTDNSVIGSIVDDIPGNNDPEYYTSTTQTGFALQLRHQFFPRVDANGNPAKTDIWLALNEAEVQLGLVRSTSVPSSDSIVLIGDGITNCCRSTDPATPCPWQRCSNTFWNYYFGMQDIKSLAKTRLAPNNIAVHTMLIGETVRPHTLDIPKDGFPGECMTDEEARMSGLSYVAGGGQDMRSYPDYPNGAEVSAAFSNAVNSSPHTDSTAWYQVNADLYHVSRLTRGVWAPIRPVAGGCIPQTTRTCNTVRRVTNDPLCRTIRQQILDYMDQILGKNPYTIVE